VARGNGKPIDYRARESINKRAHAHAVRAAPSKSALTLTRDNLREAIVEGIAYRIRQAR